MATTDLNKAALALLQEIRDLQRPDVVPQGWMTIKELAKAWNVSVQVAQGLVHRAKLEPRRYKLKTGRGLYPVRHYCVLKGGK